MYITAGHKGNPKAVKAKGREGRRRRLKGKRERGTLRKEKPPILGMFERDGDVVIRMHISNVQRTTIKPLIRSTARKESTVYTR